MTVKNHVASPRHQDFEQLGEPKNRESWKQVKDFNDILTNIDDHDVKMKYEPVVLEKDGYLKTIDYDKKYHKAMDELSQEKNSNHNISSKLIADRIAKYEYHKKNEKNSTKKKEDVEIHCCL